MAETEAVLLRRFTTSGDAEAFAEITRRHAGLVYGAALRILADVDRASDVAQETFLQLTKDAGSVTGSLPGWLHRVATHKAIDHARRDASRRHREEAYVARPPAEVSEWKDLSPYVDEGLRELDPAIRETLILHFLQGRTTRQIAGQQGISQATVSRRIEAGVGQLRAILRQRGVVVAVGTLSLLLGENAVQAAPPVLMTELGKMALAGGSAAFAAGGAAATAPALNTAVGGVLAVVKAHAVAGAVVAIIGVGSVVTYREATRPSSSRPATTTTAPAERPSSRPPRRTTNPSRVPESRPVPAPGRSQAAEEWEAMMEAAARQAGGRDAGPPAASSDAQPQVASAVARQEDAPPTEGFSGMGGMAMAGSPEPRESVPGEQAPVRTRFAAASSGEGGWYPVPVPDAGDPNDPNHPTDPNGRSP